MGPYNATSTIIVDDSKEKHIFNNDRNTLIVKRYTCANENDIFFMHRLWPCLLQLNDVSDVRLVVKSMELVH